MAAQSTEATPFISIWPKKRFGFDPVVLQPGSHVFFTNGTQDSTEIAVFNDGKLSVDVQLFGGDFAFYRQDGKLRAGLNLGLGITQFKDATVLLTGAALFVQVGTYYRIDFGVMRAKSGDPDLNDSENDQTALYTGVSFPTKLGELLKQTLK